MGRPLKLTKTVNGSVKTGIIGNTSLTGSQIRFTGYVTGGSANTGYASKQTGSTTFKITTTDGTADLKLTAVASGSLTAGQCQLTATDSAGGTYYVSKITNNYVTIGALGTGSQFEVGDKALWVTSGPTINVSVSIPTA